MHCEAIDPTPTTHSLFISSLKLDTYHLLIPHL